MVSSLASGQAVLLPFLSLTAACFSPVVISFWVSLGSGLQQLCS